MDKKNVDWLMPARCVYLFTIMIVFAPLNVFARFKNIFGYETYYIDIIMDYIIDSAFKGKNGELIAMGEM